MLDDASAPVIAGLPAALAAPALGQELAPGTAGAPVAAPAPVIVTSPAAPAADWTGFYAGGQLSFGRLDLELDGEDGEGGEGEQNLDGAVGGLHAGYLRDFGQIVAGAELAYDRADLSTHNEDATLDGYGRYGPNQSLKLTLALHDVMVVLDRRLSVSTKDETVTAGPGEVVHMPKGEAVTIRSHETGAVTAYVTYPHWRAASEG